mgnify:CR=1 FL=1
MQLLNSYKCRLLELEAADTNGVLFIAQGYLCFTCTTRHHTRRHDIVLPLEHVSVADLRAQTLPMELQLKCL